MTHQEQLTSRFFSAGMPTPAKFYILSVLGGGAVALLLALTQAHSQADEWWLLFLLLTATASYLSVSAARTGTAAGSASVSLGEFFIFGAMLVLGPAGAALMGAVEGVFSSLKVKVRRAYKILFNVAQLTVAAFSSGLILSYLAADLPPIRQMDQGNLLRLYGLMLACSLTYFLLNSIAVAIAMFLSSQGQSEKISWRGFSRALPVRCVNACLVVVVLALLTPATFWLAAVVFPLILIAYRLTRNEMHDETPQSQDPEPSGLFGGDFSPDPRPGKARRYLIGVIVLSLPVLILCLHHAVSEAQWNWLYLAFLTVVASCFPLRIFSVTDRIWLTLSDIFVFVAMFQFGPEVAVVIACLEAITFNLRTRPEGVYRWLFNVSQIILVAFVVGHFFELLRTGLADPGRLGFGSLVLFLVAPWLCGFLYYVLSSGMTALAVALSRQESFRQLWVKNLSWYFVSVIGASLAAVAYVVVNGLLPFH